MNEMIAFCGLECHQCGAFLASRDDDDIKRQEVAELWSREFNADIQAQDINCQGCGSEGGILFSHCNVCEIRKCGKEKGVANCAYCVEYTCIKLEEFLAMVPDSKIRLDNIRSGI